MEQVCELAAVSSPFCRNFVPQCGASERFCMPLAAGVKTGLGGRCSLSNQCASLREQGREWRLVARRTSLSTKTGAQRDVSVNVGNDGTSGKFGASFLRDYDVSEPQKVNQSSVSDSSGSDVLDRLKHGFVKFKEERFLKESDLFSQLAEGQQPKVMVIACADSRVCPTMLMGLNPGEVFTVRNVANLVPPCETDKGKFHGTSAALEFAVTGLGVEHIIVMGHRNCGGIKALITRETNDFESDFIGSWMSSALPAKKSTLLQMEGKSVAEKCRHCEQEAINGSLANLLTFPWIKERFEAGTLGLHGWYYDFVEGDLTSWEVKQPTLQSSLVTA